jgi:RimJ/RimL family protein N-acetyltransferase
VDAFSTPRLITERLSPAHLDELVALHRDAAVMRHLGGVHTPEQTDAYLKVNLDHWDRFGFGIFVLREPDGGFAGRAGLRHLDVDGADEVEIAYTFAQALWGRGYASEIARALAPRAFETLGLKSLVGVTTIDNHASRRVLAKVGFVVERNWMHRGHSVMIHRLWAA